MGKRKSPNQLEEHQPKTRRLDAPATPASEPAAGPAATAAGPAAPAPAANPAAPSLLLPVPSLANVEPWDPAAIPTAFPPLPPIADPAVEASVFTHPALAKPGQQNYETLEFLGDAYLEIISTVLVFQTFGGFLPPGRCAQIRELIVRNSTLAEYSHHYGLVGRVRMPIELTRERDGEHGGVQKKDAKTKVAADVFEAYVAGIVVADPSPSGEGLRRAAAWLRDLWAMTIRDQLLEHDRRRRSGGVYSAMDGGRTGMAEAKGRLAQMVAVPRASELRYEDMGAPGKDRHNGEPLYSVGVYLDGWGDRNRLLGRGSGLSKKEAGQRAALQALANEKLLKVYESKKRVFLAERDGGGGE